MRAKDFVPPSKPRNFVAKNSKTAGAGAHKDKKRAEKQGDVKHKKPYEQGVAEATGDEKFDTMMKKVAKTPTQAQRNAERIRQKKEREEETRKHFANGGGFGPSPADKLSIRKGVAEDLE
jgi:hypothetical protein